eukprot:12908944-Prorocentrum_lima.AAC.1
MTPTIPPWMFMRDPERLPMRVRKYVPTRRTSPYKVELLHGDEDHIAYDLIGIEGVTPLTAMKAQCQAKEAETV